jgi:hypothetical protein
MLTVPSHAAARAAMMYCWKAGCDKIRAQTATASTLALTLLSGPKSGARTLPPSVGSQAMDNLLFWLGIGAAQKGAGSKGLKPSRHPIISFVVGILIALAIVAGMFFLLVSQQ